MLFLRQIFSIVYYSILIWLRSPINIIFSIVLGSAFLLLGNQTNIVRLENDVVIGIYTTNAPTYRLQAAFHKSGFNSYIYEVHDEAQADLELGKISALLSYVNTNLHELTISFAGQDPVVERSIATGLLKVLSHLAKQKDPRLSLNFENISYSDREMISYQTANLLPFLILTLMVINCGIYWQKKFQRGTIYSCLLTPANRLVFIFAQTISSLMICGFIIFCSLIISRSVFAWNLPDNLGPWIMIILLQLWAASGFYFFLAVLCRKSMFLFYDISFFIVYITLFICGPLVPIKTMPLWEKCLAYACPVTYAVRIMRATMLQVGDVLWLDAIIVFVTGLFCFYLASRYIFHARISD